MIWVRRRRERALAVILIAIVLVILGLAAAGYPGTPLDQLCPIVLCSAR
jgi:hypothetical protein